MNTGVALNNELYFIAGGGEMGALIRAVDWHSTPIGNPEHWPPSLKTSVAMMLENPFGMYIAWGNELTQLYNDEYRHIFNDPDHSKALGESARDTYQQMWPVLGPMFQDVMDGKSVVFPDFQLRLNREGFAEECYFDFSYSPIRKEDGKVGGVLVTVFETTAKKQIENALAENQNQLKNIVAGLPSVIWTAAPDGGLTYISQQWEEIYGNPIAESLGYEWIKFVHPDDVQNAGALWAESLKNGTNYETEFRVSQKDNTYLWMLVRALPFYNSDGEIISWNGSNTDINDKKISEQAARESEEKFRMMADNIPNLAWTTHADGSIYWYNKRWYEFTGTNADQMLGWGWQSVHDPVTLPEVLKNFKQSVESGEPFEMIFPLRSAAGHYRQFLTRMQPVHGFNGEIRNWFGTNTDITDQLEAQQLLAESEARFRTMAEGTDILIATIDETGNATYFNTAWINFTGRRENELINFGWADIIFPEDRQFFLGQYLTAFNERKSWTGEFRVLTKTGDYKWLLAQGSVRSKKDGSFAGYISSAIDITGRKLAEDALAEREKNLKSIILQSPVAMCILKGEQHVVDLANEKMFDIWGVPPEQILNRPMFEGLPEAKNQGFEALLDDVYKTGNSFSAQGVPAILPRGALNETVYLNFVFEAYREANGIVSGILAVAIDVTAQIIARQKIEEIVAERTRELETANKDLQRSNAELAQYAYIASHDLQEPLRKISTFSHMLQDNLEGKLDEKSKRYLDKINMASQRMTALIRDVLNYSELLKGGEIFVPVDLNLVIEGIKSDYELTIIQKQATITHNQLPVIDAIPLQMAQLFGNLLGNALKFSRSDVAPIITFTSKKISKNEAALLVPGAETEFWAIQIKDNGIGFKEEYAIQIFNIFQRLHNKSDYEGTGIGLALCKKIALNHKGDLNASGSSEHGAVFNILLPAYQTQRAAQN